MQVSNIKDAGQGEATRENVKGMSEVLRVSTYAFTVKAGEATGQSEVAATPNLEGKHTHRKTWRLRRNDSNKIFSSIGRMSERTKLSKGQEHLSQS